MRDVRHIGRQYLPQQCLLLSVLLAVATLLLYMPTVGHEFLVFDDAHYVTDNAHVRQLTLGNVRWAFTTFYADNWHPITWLSHMLDCQLFGVNSAAHHFVNVALHVVNVVLLFLLLQRATGRVGRSLIVAGLFAAHPLNVETVAWVAERKSLLSFLFSLLSIAAYGIYVRRPNWKTYLGVSAGLGMALMAKPTAVSLPLAFLLLDYWPLRRFEELPFSRRWLRLWIEKLPLLAMSAAACVLTVMAQGSGGPFSPLTALPLSARIENAITAYVSYIGKTVWPANLSIFYPHPSPTGALLPFGEVMASVAILVGITVVALMYRRAPYLLVGWFFFLGTLVPVIGIVQVGGQAMADRYTYIPVIGLFVIVVWGIADATDNVPVQRAGLAAAALIAIVAFSAATRDYLQYWQNGTKLFTRAHKLASRPEYVIEELLADSLYHEGRTTEALHHYTNACVLMPRSEFCHYNIAEILFQRARHREALQEYQIAARLTGNPAMVVSCLNNSGKILWAYGNYDAAEKQFAAALQVDPNDPTALRLHAQSLSRVKCQEHK